MTLFSEKTVKLIQELDDKLFVFSTMRNEVIRIESWILHYRNIGVKRFFVVDNGSTDGTYEFLSVQPDVIVERILDSYLESNFGIAWLNRFREIVGADKWVLYADADELIVYDGWPGSIMKLTNKADAEECNAIYGFMLDMYPDGPLDTCPSEIAGSLFNVAPCFDSDYVFRFLPKKPWADKSDDVMAVIGGPRVRLLSSLKRESKISWFDLFIRGQIDRILEWVPDVLVPTVIRYFPKSMPALYKVPLSKGGTSFRYINGHQGVGQAKYYRQNVVLCHFKFLRDFDQRIKTEVKRKEHYRKGAEYIMYNDLLKKFKSLDFRYAGTQRFTSPEQLKEIGLIREMAFGWAVKKER